MAAGKFGERMEFAAEAFERPERGGELGDELAGGGQFAVGQVGTRVGMMQIDRFLAAIFAELLTKIRQRAREPGTAGARTRPAQDRTF